MPTICKEEYEEQIKSQSKKITSLKKRSTMWMVISIVLLVLFVIALAMLFAR